MKNSKLIPLLIILIAPLQMILAQDNATYTDPIIDMHLHAGSIDEWGVESPIAVCAPFEQYPVWNNYEQSFEEFFPDKYLKKTVCEDPLWSPVTEEEVMEQTLFYMEKHNVYGVLSGKLHSVQQWMNKHPDRFIPGLHFELGIDDISPDSLRSLISRGEMEVFGEIANAYYGIAPDDPRMTPYWELVEELDIPVGIHIGGSPPGEPYLGNGARSRWESPMTLEEVLIAHPRLRLYIMHAGYPMLDDLLNILHMHPQVYVDIGAIAYSKPRSAFYRYLRNIVEAGFGNRVMFGSDQLVWPETIERSINTIQEAPFLNQQQKADIFYNNAARFLELSDEEIDRHHDNFKSIDQ